MRSLLIKIIGNCYNLLSFVSEGYAANRAIALFSRPRKKRRNEEQLDFLGTAYKEELISNDLTIMTYRWLGEREPILLLHGWESDATRWKNLILNLKKRGHCVIAIDAPAHGSSGSKIFNAVIYADFINVVVKRFKPTVIIGHSVGGMAAIFAIEKFELKSILKIILLGAPSEFKDVFKRYTDMMGYNARIVKRTRDVIIERFGKKPEEFSTSKFLKNINSKGLIIHDKDDKIIPYNDALLINESFQNSTLITTNGLGHSLVGESVDNQIYDFIDT